MSKPLLPTAAPDHEQITPRQDRPTNAGVETQPALLGVVLREGRYRQVGRESIESLELPEPLDEAGLRQLAEIVFAVELDPQVPAKASEVDEGSPLDQAAAVEPAEPDVRPPISGT